VVFRYYRRKKVKTNGDGKLHEQVPLNEKEGITTFRGNIQLSANVQPTFQPTYIIVDNNNESQ
jgi:hypothetical protein